MNHAPPCLIHLDMNSYFASVEQQANPLLRGKPLGVCAYLHKNGCVIAASIEAKARGMKVGMTMEEAKGMIPDAVFVENDPPKYRAVTSRVFGILHETCDRVEHYSIDESFLDMTGWVRDPAEAAFLMARVRRRIHDEVGEWLRCSIGIAPTRFLAKLASELEKPSGLSIITQENLDEVLSRLDLEDIHGVGRRMRKRIEALGIRTPIELKRAPIANLMHAFGINGYMLWAKLNATDIEEIDADPGPPKSIGHSYCVPMTANRQGKIRAILAKLAEKAARRMRREELFAGTVSVNVGFKGEGGGMKGDHPVSFWHGGDSDFTRFDEPVDDSFTLVGAALNLLDSMWDGKQAVSFLAVTFSEFGSPSGQMEIVASGVGRRCVGSADARRPFLSRAMDAIKDKHGDESLILGHAFGVARADAPERIGFRKTDGVEMGWK
jgi:nucleotidyltransferase/DNA polymerase involved in DNA repair